MQYRTCPIRALWDYCQVRDRPFNLKRVFVSFRIFFSDNTRVRIFIFLLREARIFFPEFNIRLYDKNSESDYFFFPPPKSEYFFQQHWESEYFFRKKTITRPFKLNGRSLRGSQPGSLFCFLDGKSASSRQFFTQHLNLLLH